MVATLDQYQEVAQNVSGGYAFGDYANTSEGRCRKMSRFWLDLSKLDQLALAEWVEDLKFKRRFAQTIREALALIRDLRQHQTTVLERLFPWIVDHYRAQFAAGQGDLEARLFALEQQLSILALHQSTTPPPAPGSKPLTVPVPAEDEGDTLVVRKAKSDGQSAQNFLTSAFSLVQ